MWCLRRVPIAPRRELPLGRGEAPIDLAGTDGPELLAHCGRQPEPAPGQGSHRGSRAFKRTDQGYPAASQIAVNAWIMAAPYVAGRRRRRGRAAPGGGPLRSRRAYFR